MLKLAIIEDNDQYRELLKDYFAQNSLKIECVYAVDSVEKFFKYYSKNLELDIILVDIQLKGVDGIKGVNQLRRTLKDSIEFIMLTSFDDSNKIFQALTAGATGYLLKNMTFEEIEEELLKTVENGAAMSPQIARRIIKYFNPSKSVLETSFDDALNEKEIQICKLVVDGKTYEEIAPILGLTINGLKYHVKSIYKKLQIKSKSEIIKRYYKN